MAAASPIFIHGIGAAVPARSLTAGESVDLFHQACPDERTARLLRRVVRLTGIERRHLASLDYQSAEGVSPLYRPCAEQPHGPGMGARNALFEQAAAPLVREALQTFDADALRRVDLLITASCTHASSPGLERPVMAAVPLRPAIDRWNLGFMGCSAGLAALRLVQRTCQDPGGALIVACELSSLHFQYTDQIDQLTANVLFADGAAAVLLSPRPARLRLLDTRCATLPAASDQMTWFADDHGLRLTLSQDLPDTLAAALPAAVGALLDRHELRLADIDRWLVHPGGPQILDAVEQCLALSPGSLDLSREVLRRLGNMSSPTIFFIMKALLDSGASGRCVALAFGPGLTIEMALLEMA